MLEQTGRKGFGRINLSTELCWEMQVTKRALQKLGKSKSLAEHACCHDFFGLVGCFSGYL